MFRYFLAFLLINTCYQSLGNPIEPSAPNLSNSLDKLASQCKNAVLIKHIQNQIKDCAVSVAPTYSEKQIQCLIFYDINTQLCSANVTVNEDSFSKLEDKQDVNTICTLAKDWVFTNISEFVTYKKSAEQFFKLPATCGEACGVEAVMTEANYFCKYYQTGLELLKSKPTTEVHNTAIPPQPDFSGQEDNPVLANSDPVKPQESNTKKFNGQINQPAAAKTIPQKGGDAVDDGVVKSDTGAQATSKQIPSGDDGDNAENADNEDVNVKRQEDAVVAAPELAAPQANKTVVVQAEKPLVSDEAAVGDLPVGSISEQKQAVIENPKPKANADDEYPDSMDEDEANRDDDDVKPEQQNINQENFQQKNVIVPPVHEADVSQKEFFPNSMPDGFSEQDDDHFFPFFMTSVILMVLLYVLYHNKSKVSKVFFGLILEGRQSGRRRNSRGHAYRRLDTLEQAMSANTAAPPSKIIY